MRVLVDGVVGKKHLVSALAERQRVGLESIEDFIEPLCSGMSVCYFSTLLSRERVVICHPEGPHCLILRPSHTSWCCVSFSVPYHVPDAQIYGQRGGRRCLQQEIC
jgi:hypothetical protein